MALDTLTVSSQGQIVLPTDVLERLSITAGSRLAIDISEDIITLKVIDVPDDKEYFRNMLDEAQAWAKEVGYSEEDVNEIIKSVRRRKREQKQI